MKKLIVVADWVQDSLSVQEVKSAIHGYIKSSDIPQISFVSSTPSTIHTAFLLKQLVEVEDVYGHPLETVIFQNTDMRTSSDKGLGGEFLVNRLHNGMYICGPNVEFNFSMIKDQIAEVFTYPGIDSPSQFKSRDVYSRVCAHLMEYMEDDLELEETHSNCIQELRGHYIGHIDNFGNIKTTIKAEDFKGKHSFGDKVKITINHITKEAEYVPHLFGGKPGMLAIYPGSSGHKDNPYLEISIWRNFNGENRVTGYEAFNKPRVGMDVKV